MYNPLANKGTITIFHPDELMELLDFSNRWQIDPIAVGNIILKHCFGKEWGVINPEESRIENIIVDIPDIAVYGIGYVEDYYTKRHSVLSDYITNFFHTLLCEFYRQNQHSMLSKEMQIIKFCQSGVYIYNEDD
jgi:hypothetical protein